MGIHLFDFSYLTMKLKKDQAKSILRDQLTSTLEDMSQSKPTRLSESISQSVNKNSRIAEESIEVMIYSTLKSKKTFD